MDLFLVQKAIVHGDYQYTSHALQRATRRHISRSELEQAIAAGEIIEEYPNDKYGPSCLIFGITKNKRPLHIVVSMPPPQAKIITVYEPDPEKWENYRARK